MSKKAVSSAGNGAHQGIRRKDELAILYKLTDSLFRARSRDEIFDAALDAIQTALSSRASILLFDSTGVMSFVAWRGLSEEYRTTLQGHSPWKPGDTEAEPIFVEDIDATAEPEWIKAIIREESIRGLAFIPLFSQGKVIGKFMIYYADRHPFLGVERDLAITIARQLGFALERAQIDEARLAVSAELRESEERFRVMSEEAPIMIWLSDSQGGCIHLNRMLREFWGVDPANVSSFDWRPTMHPDDRANIISAMSRAIGEQTSVTIEGRYLNAGGEFRVLRTNARPRFSSNGQFLGMIGVNIDLSERRRAEAELREREERLRVALAAGRMGTWHYNLQTGAQIWDSRQYELFGVNPSVQPTRELFLSLIHPDDIENVVLDVDSLRFREFLDSEFRIIRPDGEIRWLTAHSLAQFNERGEPTDVIGVNFDITEQKESAQRLRLLLDELNHRVKNMLAVVQAIAHQTFRNGRSIVEARRAFEGRLLALATAQNQLTQSNWKDASLEQIVRDTLHGQGVAPERVHIAGTEVQLSAKQALAMVLVLHELCTNALKYGSLSNDQGRVEIAWSKEELTRSMLQLSWMEIGGPQVAPPERQGFGSRLIQQMLERDMEGEVSLQFNPDGLLCSVKAPVGLSLQ